MPTASMNFTNIFIHFHWKVGGIIQMETSCKRTIAPTPAWQRQVFVRQSIILWTSTEVKQHHNFFFVITLWQPTCSPLQSPCSELHSAANGPSISVNNAKVWNTFLCHSKLLDALRLRSILAVPYWIFCSSNQLFAWKKLGWDLCDKTTSKSGNACW